MLGLDQEALMLALALGLLVLPLALGLRPLAFGFLVLSLSFGLRVLQLLRLDGVLQALALTEEQKDGQILVEQSQLLADLRENLGLQHPVVVTGWPLVSRV